MILVNRFYGASLGYAHRDQYNESDWKDKDGKIDKVHFALYRKPRAGDLVMGTTGLMRGVHHWSIGFFVEPLPDGAVIREIGTDNLCDYTNEQFAVIDGLHKSHLLEGEQYKMSIKVQQAFSKGDEYSYRYGGCDFDGDSVKIWIREAFGGLSRQSIPFSVTMKYDRKTSVKKILSAMKTGGYSTRKFDPAPEEVKA